MQNKAVSEKKTDVKFVLITAGKLLLICSFIAVLVAFVNAITKDRILLNQKIKTATALSDIYASDGLAFSVDETGAYVALDQTGTVIGGCEELTEVQKLPDIKTVYSVYLTDGASKTAFGYCVEAEPMGFKDRVGVLVAVNPDATAKDVKIVSMADTKGIGDKVMDRSFLDPFIGKTSGFAQNKDELDSLIIAGATRTSKPVTVAIDTALEQISQLLDGGADK